MTAIHLLMPFLEQLRHNKYTETQEFPACGPGHAAPGGLVPAAQHHHPDGCQPGSSLCQKWLLSLFLGRNPPVSHSLAWAQQQHQTSALLVVVDVVVPGFRSVVPGLRLGLLFHGPIPHWLSRSMLVIPFHTGYPSPAWSLGGHQGGDTMGTELGVPGVHGTVGTELGVPGGCDTAGTGSVVPRGCDTAGSGSDVPRGCDTADGDSAGCHPGLVAPHWGWG